MSSITRQQQRSKGVVDQAEIVNCFQSMANEGSQIVANYIKFHLVSVLTVYVLYGSFPLSLACYFSRCRDRKIFSPIFSNDTSNKV